MIPPIVGFLTVMGFTLWAWAYLTSTPAIHCTIPPPQDMHKALHKCQPSATHNERATGFSSAITVGSLLPARLPMMKGSVVEVLVTPREVAVIVSNPADGAEMVWQNNATVARPYT